MPYVPVLFTRGALVAHRYTHAPPRCRTSLYSSTAGFTAGLTAVPQDLPQHHMDSPNSLCGTIDLADHVFDGVGLTGFKIMANTLLLAYAAFSPFVFFYFTFLFSLSIGWYCGAGVFGLIGRKSLSLSLALPTTFNDH